MTKSRSAKSRAWDFFDAIVDEAAPGGEHTNPWVCSPHGTLLYQPDFSVLEQLLGVPLLLAAPTTSGVPALALDVWIAYELRRAGFEQDIVWPRPLRPRVLPAPVAALLRAVTKDERAKLLNRLSVGSAPQGAAAASASILGKNYLKQVDVVISDWVSGPELLISTKRMDSSFGNNAANRVEESYGDAKNLGLRHPLAALGFVFGVRSTIFEEAPEKAEWLKDLLQKLGREDDAYHAVALLVLEYDLPVGSSSESEDADPEGNVDDGVLDLEDLREGPDDGVPGTRRAAVLEELENVPRVKVRQDLVPPQLAPGAFLAEMATRVVDATPVAFHSEVRSRMAAARASTT